MCGLPGDPLGLGNKLNDPLDLFHGQARADARSAEARAAAAEAARQGRISANVAGINSAYDGREPQYAQLGDALRERLNAELGRQRKDAARQSKFSVARSGLTGGSVQRDVGTRLAREGAEGVLSAERVAQKGVSDLRSADEQARTQLISLAQSGSDIGNAASQAASMLKANLSGAGALNPAAGLGDVFAATATSNKNMQDAAARRRGLTEAQTYANPFSRGT